MPLSPLHRRILDLSYKHKRSHIGSCLGCVDLLDAIYKERKADEPVVLSCGHAGLALYVTLENHTGADAEDLLARHGVHPSRDLEDGIWCSTGSLGQGVTVAVGHALARRDRRVFCVLSDGEVAEGSVYESLVFASTARLTNLLLFVAVNGYSAYRQVDIQETVRRLRILYPGIRIQVRPIDTFGLPFLKGQSAHYHTMSDEDYAWVVAQGVEPAPVSSTPST